MKRILVVLILIIGIVSVSSCEKDDICVDGDTPFLIIGFYDASLEDTTVFKAVPNLRIRVLDNDRIYSNIDSPVFTDRATVQDSIFIPLNFENSSTSFEFIINSADDDSMLETGTIDTLTFNYTVGEQFVSRACGFVANYNELDTTRNVSAQDWIKRINLLERSIKNNPTAIHVQIFH